MPPKLSQCYRLPGVCVKLNSSHAQIIEI